VEFRAAESPFKIRDAVATNARRVRKRVAERRPRVETSSQRADGRSASCARR
jgi:hypothetical protein